MSKRLLGQLDLGMWKRQTRYSYRRHPYKFWYGCKQRYGGKIPSRQANWFFMNPKTGQYLYKLRGIPIYRHSLVKGRYSPDDPNWKDYWAKRPQTRIPYGIKVRMKLWKRQKGPCIRCQSALDNGEALHVHPIKARSKGAGDELSTLCILHGVCHQQIPSRYGKKLKPLTAA